MKEDLDQGDLNIYWLENIEQGADFHHYPQ